jgi:hypothetical protein
LVDKKEVISSIWEQMQKMTNEGGALGDKIELTIPGVLYVCKDGDKYVIYVSINGEWVRLSNIEGVGRNDYELILGKHDRKENTKISEQSTRNQSSKVEPGGKAEG